MTAVSRRTFLRGTVAAGAAAAWAPRLAFASAGTAGSSPHCLVVVSLRGGMDGLSAVVPVEAGYFDRRPTIAVPENRLLALDDGFGMHPALAPLHDHWAAAHLAVIPGAGTPTASRSHFEETDLVEHGVGELGLPVRTGWLARHLASRPQGPGTGLPAAAVGALLPDSLAGCITAAAVSNVGSFSVQGVGARDQVRVHAALGQLYSDPIDPLIAGQAATTLATIELLRATNPGAIPPANGAVYPNHPWARLLQQVAQLVRAEVGLEVATVDFGGWDTHVDMGRWDGGWMATLLGNLGGALAAFLTDVADVLDRVTVVVVSEFGRRVTENASGGLDHGRGGLMLLAGGGARPGVHGAWPGLSEDVLDRGDVPTVTDYRAVLAEILRDVLDNPNLDQVFPGYTPVAVGSAG